MKKSLAVLSLGFLLPLGSSSTAATAASVQPVIGPTVTAIEQEWAAYPTLMIEETNLKGTLPAKQAKVKDLQVAQGEARKQETAARAAYEKSSKLWKSAVGDRASQQAKAASVLHLSSFLQEVKQVVPALPVDSLIKKLSQQATTLDQTARMEATTMPSAQAYLKAEAQRMAFDKQVAAAQAVVTTTTQQVTTLEGKRVALLQQLDKNLLTAVAKDRGINPSLLAGTNATTLSPVAWVQLSSPLCAPVAPTASNGMLPNTSLCYIGVGKHMLRPEAARSYVAMATAYQQHFNTPLCITDSYRSLDEQETLKAEKPVLAAKPGTSNHGWGMAVDLCGGIESFGTPQHQWLDQNALAYGFYHPSWAEATGSKPEPWHWEFIGTTNS